MKIITVYECENCGYIYKDESEIFKCKECGREICDECCGFEEGYCWTCSDKHIDDEEGE